MSDKAIESAAEYVIEKDVPIPPVNKGGPRSPISRAMAKLEIGDSFVMERKGTNTAHVMAKHHGIKVKTRMEPKGLRVWRVA